jgi:hypothetical protein
VFGWQKTKNNNPKPHKAGVLTKMSAKSHHIYSYVLFNLCTLNDGSEARDVI